MCINLALLMEKQVIYVECFLQLRMSVQPSGTFTCSRKSLANELAHNRGARGPEKKSLNFELGKHFVKNLTKLIYKFLGIKTMKNLQFKLIIRH